MKQEPITIEDFKEFFSKIVRIRTIEQAIAERYHAQEMKCPMHLSIGQEGPAVAISMQLNASDKMLRNWLQWWNGRVNAPNRQIMWI